MKRILGVLILLLLVCVLVSGCNTLPDEPPQETSQTESDSVPIPTLQISGVDISEFRIVYDSLNKNGEKDAAEVLAEYLKQHFLVELDVRSEVDATDPVAHEILVGEVTDRVNLFKSTAEGFANYRLDLMNGMLITQQGHLWLAATGTYAMEAVLKALLEEITPTTADVMVNIDYSTEETAMNIPVTVLGEPLKILSYNVKTGKDYATRSEQVIGNIRAYNPDIIGVQEAHYGWIHEFSNAGLLETYRFVGRPREGYENYNKTGNEYSAILYRNDMFTEIESGTYWLTETPEIPSKLEKANYPRVMSYVVLERKSDGVRFLHVNTHIDNTGSNPYADEVKKQQTLILLSLTYGLSEKYGGIPISMTGDFNQLSSAQGYAYVLQSGFDDTHKTAEKVVTMSGKIIDYCFASKGDFLAVKSEFGLNCIGSDHKPLYTVLYLIPEEFKS